MLPNIRAVVAAIAGAIGLLTISFALAATFRAAQESRAGSLQADLTLRGRASPPEHRPITIIETPGPTVLAKAPAEVEVHTPELAEIVPTAPRADVAVLEPAPAPETPPIAADEPAPAAIAAAPLAAAPEREWDAPSPVLPPIAMGGPSPGEVTQARARQQAAERAKAKKVSAARAKRAHTARIARKAARRAAQARAKQQANSFNAGSFNNAPFGTSFGSFGNNTNGP